MPSHVFACWYTSLLHVIVDNRQVDNLSGLIYSKQLHPEQLWSSEAALTRLCHAASACLLPTLTCSSLVQQCSTADIWSQPHVVAAACKILRSTAVQEAAGADTPALLFAAFCHSQALQPILQTC